MPHDLSTAEVGEFYDQVTDLLARVYNDNLHIGYWPDSTRGSVEQAAERMTDELVRRLTVGPGKSVLDVGCGIGMPALRLARATGASVLGISISTHQVDLANSNARAERLADQVHFEHADALKLPFPDDYFDAAWALESMLHMPDRKRVLQEIARVVRPGGRIAVADIVVRGELDDIARTVVAEYQEVAQVDSVEHIEDYPVLVSEAGLELMELTDVSAETLPSYPRFFDAMNDARNEFTALMGSDTFDTLLARNRAFHALPQAGYVLFTAIVP